MKKLFIPGFMLLAWGHGISQTVTTTRYPEQKAITMRFQDIPDASRIVTDDSVHVPDHITPDFHGIVPLSYDRQSVRSERNDDQGRMTTSPPPCLDFKGLHDNETPSTTVPPDVNGAVGISHLMVTQNTGVRIILKTSGIPIQSKSLRSFFTALSATAPFDPKVVYDPFENRWIVVAAEGTTSITSRILVAVSQTADPTGVWHYYFFYPGASTWLDYPSLGFNKNWIVITGNMFNNMNSFLHNAVFVINKATAYAGSPISPVKFTVGSAGSTLQPCITYDNTLETEWLCNNWNSNTMGAGYLRLYQITGTASAPVFNPTTMYPSTLSPWYSGQQIVPVATCPAVDLGDSRVRTLVYQQGSLWACQKVGLPASSPSRVATQWWEIHPGNGMPTQFGRIEDVSGFNMYFNPSLAVNDNRDVLVGYSHYSPAHGFPAAGYSFRNATFPAGGMETYYDYRTSTRMDCRPTGTARWGDYSSTVMDPNRTDLWTLQQYVPVSTGSGSWWAKICLSPACIPVQTITAPVSTANMKYEASDHVTGTSLINPPNGFVKFDGDKYVELNPGFRTQINTGFFEAYIDGCGGLRITENSETSRGGVPPNVVQGTSAEAIAQSGIRLFPNPAENLLTISMTPEEGLIVQVLILDALGNTIRRQSGLSKSASIDISTMSRGAYFIVVRTQLNEYKASFVKQ